MIPVIWHTDAPGVANRGYWDQGWLEDIFSGDMWLPAARRPFFHRYGFDEMLPHTSGAIVVIPARHYVTDIETIQSGISRLGWVLLVLTGDEEGKFPWRDLSHPNMRVWAQTPYPDRHADVSMRVPDFAPPGTRFALSEVRLPEDFPERDWFFAGQVNNAARRECVSVLTDRLMSHNDGNLILTPGFTLGLDRTLYLRQLSRARIAPAPSGNFVPDTFRTFEALEAGVVPIADWSAPESGDNGYWPFLFGGDPVFPTVKSWAEAPEVIDSILADWPASANLVSAWWQGYKRGVVERFWEDLAVLAGPHPVSSSITVVVPTSPIPSHPSTDIIIATVSSVRSRLPDAEIIICIDGVRPEQEDRRAAYEEYQRQLLWLTNNVWHNVLPLRFPGHHHQAAMTRAALDHVRTPVILFVEHDTPLCGEIPFPDLAKVIVSGEANLIRLHHESQILDVHRPLMLDPSPQAVEGVPLVRTIQWSQRPQLASTEYYRVILNQYFSANERHMIEDRMHGIIQSAGRKGWDKHKIWIYAPEGDMKRSEHLDGRGDDPKWVDS